MFVLLHSPLVGPLTWTLVAAEFQKQGIATIVPTLPPSAHLQPPYWQRHVEAIAATLTTLPATTELILVGHSGAGVLLPALRQIIQHKVIGYIFVDADIPRNGASRFDLFDVPETVAQFRDAAENGLLPVWRAEDLQEVIEDFTIRQRLVAELQPLPLAVYEEPLPVFTGWPDAHCAYLALSASYPSSEQYAQQADWAYAQIIGGHFHMLVDPAAVAQAIFSLLL